jgi:hypothetical protein
VIKATKSADAGQWDAAIATLLKARTIAPNASEKESVDEFLRVCRFRSSSDRAIALAEEGRWAEAAAAATEAHQLAFDDEQRKQLAGLAAYWRAAAARGAPTPRQVAEAASRRSRNGWIAAAVVIGLIVLFIIISANQGSSSTGSGAGSTTTDANVTTQCQSSKSALASQMNSLQSDMSQLISQLNSLKAQINSYGGPNYAPGSLINQYNADVDRYNADLATYNADVPQYNAMGC